MRGEKSNFIRKVLQDGVSSPVAVVREVRNRYGTVVTPNLVQRVKHYHPKTIPIAQVVPVGVTVDTGLDADNENKTFKFGEVYAVKQAIAKIGSADRLIELAEMLKNIAV